MSHIRLSVTPGGTREVIEVDGHDIAHAVRGYSLTAKVGEVARLQVEIPISRRSDVEDTAVVTVDDETRQVLLALGWTPPD